MNKRRYIKGSLRKNDFLRALLTDTSPYELPIIISNDGFYKNVTASSSSSAVLKEFVQRFVVDDMPHYTIPFRFNISKDKNSRRKLSLIHPKSQYKISKFYDAYDTLICYYCSLSNSSMRKPSRTGSTFFFKSPLGDNNSYRDNKVDTINLDKFIRNPASFFSYEGVDRLYKFFGSNEFMRLEKKYSHMRLMDISKCFSSIYTHSVSWAVKNSQHSKDNNQAFSFGNEFDKLMQKMNYNETNGICIGPEISRVFAEVILSGIDAKIREKSFYKNIIMGKDFEYRRYVDDFVLFCHSKETAAVITSIIEDCLSSFNLHLNEAKTVDFDRPFSTPKSQMIENAKGRLSAFFEGILEKSPSGNLIPKKIYRPNAIVRSLVSSIRGACFEEDVGYDLIANYIISSLVKRVEALIRDHDAALEKSEVDAELYTPVLLRMVEAVFFFYTVSPTVASSFNVSRCMIILWRYLSEKRPEEILSASGQMHRWISQLIRQPSFDIHLNTHEKIPVEFLNIILASSDIKGADQFDQELLEKTIFSPDKKDYFSLVSCLFYVKRSPAYARLRARTEQTILSVLDGCKRVRNSAHDAHLALDAICCPYLSLDARKSILGDFREAIGLSQRADVELDADIIEMESKPWFVQWEKLDILRMVTKKELSAVY